MRRISVKHSSCDRKWNHGRHNYVCPWAPNIVKKRKYSLTTSQDINKVTLYLYSLCSAIRNASLDFSTLHFTIISHSCASVSSAQTLSLSFFPALALTTNLVNLSHTMGAVSRPQRHILLSNYRKNLQCWSESYNKMHTIYMMGN